MEELKSKEIWKKTLDANPSGKEFVKPKEKQFKDNGAAHLRWYNKQQSEKRKKKIDDKKKQFKAMTSIRDGSTPATQKQIDYIEFIKSGSKKTYDYYYPRDKYFLSQKVASAFIAAIQNQQDFTFNRGVSAKQKAIDTWREAKRMEEIEMYENDGINNNN